MEYRKTEALIIQKQDYRETSQIITCFTRDYGKLRLLAKGSKRAQNNFEGPLDLLQYTKITFIDKLSSSRGYVSRLNLLIDSKIQEGFPALRNNLTKFYQACYIAEFLNELIPDGEKYSELFELVLRTLRELSANDLSSRTALVLFSFEAQAIKYLGYMPHTKLCAQCGGRILLGEGKAVVFSNQAGGVLCNTCASQERHNNLTLTTNLGILSLFYNLANTLTTSLDRIKITEESIQELRRLLRYYITNIAGKEFRTFNYL